MGDAGKQVDAAFAHGLELREQAERCDDRVTDADRGEVVEAQGVVLGGVPAEHPGLAELLPRHQSLRLHGGHRALGQESVFNRLSVGDPGGEQIGLRDDRKRVVEHVAGNAEDIRDTVEQRLEAHTAAHQQGEVEDAVLDAAVYAHLVGKLVIAFAHLIQAGKRDHGHVGGERFDRFVEMQHECSVRKMTIPDRVELGRVAEADRLGRDQRDARNGVAQIQEIGYLLLYFAQFERFHCVEVQNG